jgi:4-diphosphocytidyl-2-C-methyl-D-erythritol kinase
VRAYQLLAADYDLPPVSIRLHKTIPSQAGMGGGSSDGAFMLRLLNDQFQLGIDTCSLQQYAMKLGADCPFFISTDLEDPQPMFATGIGEKLQPVAGEWDVLDGKWIALVKPNVSVSTKEAYQKITPRKPAKSCKEIILQPIETWKDELVNDFEAAVFDEQPVLREIKEYLYTAGAIYAQMSGSGSTVFGIFNHEPSFVEDKYSECFTKILKL